MAGLKDRDTDMQPTGMAFRLAETPSKPHAPGRSSDRAVAGAVRVEVTPLSASDRCFSRAWDDLAAAASEPNVFAERWFVTAGIDLPLAVGAQMLRVWRGAELIGLFPFAILPRYGRLPLRHVQNWLHHHSFLGTPLLRAGHEQEAWSAILATLDTAPWAKGLLHIDGLVESGPVHRALTAAAAVLDRPCDVVHRIERALLQSDLTPVAYYETTVRKKKRKELNRLQSRLAELGTVTTRRLNAVEHLDEWVDMFLSLERSGWKGRAGSALVCQPETAAFFRDALHGAWRAGRLEMLRLEVDDRTIAVLVNFIAPPGSFSFKTAFDEAYARYSPGVLIQLENLGILTRDDIAWMDSCAAESHPMINSLWGERRTIVRVTLPLGGWRSRGLFHAARTIERTAAAIRARRQPAVAESEE